MSLDQNKTINETNNNDDNKNDSNQNNFLTQLKDKINSIENKEELYLEINEEKESKKENDILKTENKEKEDGKNNIIKIDEDKNNKNNNLINNNVNIQLIDENTKDNKNSNDIKLIEEKSNKNEFEITENQNNINNTENNNDINTKNEKAKEDNKITQENTINKEDSVKNEKQTNYIKTDNKKELSEINSNPNTIEPNNTTENNKIQENKDNKINIEKEEKEKEEEKHKINFSCLNKCIQWSLNIDIKAKTQSQLPSDFKSQYLFKGSSIFFKKLDQSLINSLHNPQNITSSYYKNMPYNLILDSKKIESNKNLEIINQSSLEQASSLKDLLNYSYPIDNTKQNYFFINANLSMKDNLKNIFLIEVNLDQIKEGDNNEQDFRKINDYCVEKEIDFKLNGFIHGKKMFKNDLNFSVGYRDFIKGIQFQIKSKLQKNKNMGQNNQQNIFFAKVLNNANLGIEFFVPSLNENSQTNFNAIVNSHIEIKKIFLELTIPNNLFGNIKSNSSNIIEGVTEDSNSISTKRTEINSPKKEENNISNSNSNHNSNKNLNFNMNKNNIPNINNNNNNLAETIKNYIFHSNVSSPNPQNFVINRSIPASPHLNNYQQYLYQQKYSPLMNPHFNNNNINNFNLVQNNFRPIPNHNSFYSATPNYPLSPAPPQPQQMFGSPQPNINNINTFSPLSASLMMMKMPYQGRIIQQQPLSMNSPFNTSNYSSPYLGQNMNGNNISLNSSNNRKNSESFLNENQVNNFKRQVYNSNHHTPLMMRNEEEYLNKFMSPKSMGPSTSFNLGNNNMMNLNLNNNKINGSLYQLNPMNNINQMKQQMNQIGNINQMGNVTPMTIRQKIFEKTKNEEVERINKLLNTMNRIRPNNNNNNINNNNINNININNMTNINNFNNSSVNNNLRTNIIKNNIISNVNLNNPNNINNFNNINAIKNIANIHNIQNNQNIQNIMNINNNINININNINNMNRINSNINYQMNINHEKIEMNEKQKIKNLFIIENQNKTNLDLFLKAVTPIYKIPKENDISKIKIQNIFDNLKLISLLGLKTIYYNNGELLDIWYSLSLSSLVIKITNKQLITKMFQEIKNKRKDLDNLILNQSEEIVISESLFTLYFTTEYLEISYLELKPDYSRKSYNTLLKSIKRAIPFFEQITIEDIDISKSYFALLYSSVKILKPFTPHSLVVYYNFNNEHIQENRNVVISNNEKYYKQTIAGILPIKVNSDFFMQKIIFKQQMQPYRFFNQDNFPIVNMSYNILNEIQKYSRGNSYDFELFLKLKNYNYNKQ